MSMALKVMTYAAVVATLAAAVSLWFGFPEYRDGQSSLFDWIYFPLTIVAMVWLLRFAVSRKMKADNNA